MRLFVLVHIITLIAFQIFFIVLSMQNISGQDSVLCARVVALPHLLFELSPLNEL